MAKISDSEYDKFSKQLAQNFERKIKGFYIPTSLMDVPLGVRVVPLPTAEDVMNMDSAKIKNNEIYFFTKSYKQSVYNLLRHFRNCGSHKDAITKEERNGEWFYVFEDRGYNGSPYVSMKGNIAFDKWDSFIDELYKIVLKERQIIKQKNQKK